jgi:hypothetical protein
MMEYHGTMMPSLEHDAKNGIQNENIIKEFSNE